MKIKNRTLFGAFAVFAASLPLAATAHDFWMTAGDFMPEAPGAVKFAVEIGHPNDRSAWPMAPERVVALRSIGPDGVTDQQLGLPHSAGAHAYSAALMKPGFHMVTLETVRARSVLPAEKFNAYLEEEGLTPVTKMRTALGIEEDEGRERYSRRGKMLVRVGDASDTDDSHVTQAVGMTLEIVPMANPHRLAAGASLPAKVLYRGVPTAGVKVVMMRLDDTSALTQTATTAGDGSVAFPRPETGDWMLHAVWSSPIANDPEAEYDTIFSSLTFGF